MKTYKQLTEAEKGMIVGLKIDERSDRDIGKILGRHHQTISHWYNRYQSSGQWENSPSGNRPEKLSKREITRIKILCRRDPFISIRKIKEDIGRLDICDRTVARALDNYCGIKSYWAKKKPFISTKNQKLRLNWAKRYRLWSVERWRKVIWSDESPFMLRYQGKKRVLRHHNERYQSQFMQGTVKHDKKINVWGCFAHHGVGRLHRIEGNMDQHMFKNILIHQYQPSMQNLFPEGGAILQQDNDPKHTAKSVQEYIISKKNGMFLNGRLNHPILILSRTYGIKWTGK